MHIEDATIEQLEEEIKLRKEYEASNIFLELVNIISKANKKGIKIFNFDSDDETIINEFMIDSGKIYYKEKDVKW